MARGKRWYPTRYTAVDNSNIFIAGTNPYGFRYNIQNPQVRKLYEEYRQRNKITYICSSAERIAFEREVDKLLFPNGIPEDEQNRRMISDIIAPAMRLAKW